MQEVWLLSSRFTATTFSQPTTPAAAKAQVRRTIVVCLREELWSLSHTTCRSCVMHTMCKQGTQWQCLHQVIKAPQRQVAKCNYHTIFPKGKKEEATEEWKFTAMECSSSMAHLRETWMVAGTLSPATIRKEQECPQHIYGGTSKPTLKYTQRPKEGSNYYSHVFTQWRGGNHSSRQYWNTRRTIHSLLGI